LAVPYADWISGKGPLARVAPLCTMNRRTFGGQTASRRLWHVPRGRNVDGRHGHRPGAPR
jgi:hypothetical protein